MTNAYPPQPPAVFVATHQDSKGNPYMLAADIYWDDYGAPAGHSTSPRVALKPLHQETKPFHQLQLGV
ncbi:MAG: hypothetical protein BWK73_09275 [Thiothrix lacustris]|uniref:Uncharacterized protein n=1 Tax=Thiothrix lacustris TaxID=525917 RepID=A0A1Y1QV42_9GAMM|nr:MAG: hypothetical protein BWK73_09275 [Thiothrix lacustris]